MSTNTFCVGPLRILQCNACNVDLTGCGTVEGTLQEVLVVIGGVNLGPSVPMPHIAPT